MGPAVENPHVTFDSLEVKSSPWDPRGWAQDPVGRVCSRASPWMEGTDQCAPPARGLWAPSAGRKQVRC